MVKMSHLNICRDAGTCQRKNDEMKKKKTVKRIEEKRTLKFKVKAYHSTNSYFSFTFD